MPFSSVAGELKKKERKGDKKGSLRLHRCNRWEAEVRKRRGRERKAISPYLPLHTNQVMIR